MEQDDVPLLQSQSGNGNMQSTAGHNRNGGDGASAGGAWTGSPPRSPRAPASRPPEADGRGPSLRSTLAAGFENLSAGLNVTGLVKSAGVGVTRLRIMSFKTGLAVRTVWMETVHAWAHLWFPQTSAFLDRAGVDMFDFTTYQFRSYFRVHLAHFLISPLIGGLLISSQRDIPFLDAWFSGCAAMTGGSLMTYDVSKLDRFGEGVLWALMVVGGVTIMCLPPALNRMYIFRCKLRPALREARALTAEVLLLAREAGAADAEQLAEDIKVFEVMEEEYQLKDEAQEVVAILVGVYTGCWHFFGSALLYMLISMRGPVVEYAKRGISDAWFSVFMMASNLNNVGLSLLDDSMFPFSDRPAPLMLMVFAMIFGNTAWPIAFRIIVFCLSKVFPNSRSIRYVLDHPQDSSPSLFNTQQTYGLVGAVLVSNIFMVTMFMACSTELIRDGRSTSTILYLAFFQCANSRSAGLQVFDLKRISKNMLVIIGFFMWYAPVPLVAIIAGDEFNMVFHNNPVLSGFIKKYTNRHTTYLTIVFIIISTVEQPLLADSGNWPPGDKPSTTLFNILFEMLSAYGTNGLSMGFPGVNHSLSGMFRPLSKLCIMFLMILGRHRSMSGKSDATLMPSLARVVAHVERLKTERSELTAEKRMSDASLSVVVACGPPTDEPAGRTSVGGRGLSPVDGNGSVHFRFVKKPED